MVMNGRPRSPTFGNYVPVRTLNRSFKQSRPTPERLSRYLKKSLALLMAFAMLFQTACASAPPPTIADTRKNASAASARLDASGGTAPVFVAKKRSALVLMPLRASGNVAQAQKEAFETALSEELGKYFVVYAGKRVSAKVDEVFGRRSAEAKEGQQCDDTKCLRDVAMEFQAEYVAIAGVGQDVDGYLLTLNILDIVEDQVMYSRSDPCKGCDKYAVVDKLKTLAAGSGLVGVSTADGLPPAPPPVKEESSWWKWALGILLVGGVAAAAGDGGGGGSSGGGASSGTTTAPTTVRW